MIVQPRCGARACVHFLGLAEPVGGEEDGVPICEAFPNGIPNEIAFGDNPHLKPYPGDNGITYEQGDWVESEQ